jgi:acetyltransferase-like isoleucine patch superfamily enzyme
MHIVWGFRRLVLKLRGFKIGKNVRIGKNALISARNVEIGDHVTIGDNFTVGNLHDLIIKDYTIISENMLADCAPDSNSKLVIGYNGWVGSNCHLNCSESILIGNNVTIGHRSCFWTHGRALPVAMGYKALLAAIKVGDNSWIAAGCHILPGVTIGQDSIANVGSVVRKDIKPGVMVSGVPAEHAANTAAVQERLSVEQSLHVMFSEFILNARALGFSVKENSEFNLTVRWPFGIFNVIYFSDINDKNIKELPSNISCLLITDTSPIKQINGYSIFNMRDGTYTKRNTMAEFIFMYVLTSRSIMKFIPISQ